MQCGYHASAAAGSAAAADVRLERSMGQKQDIYFVPMCAYRRSHAVEQLHAGLNIHQVDFRSPAARRKAGVQKQSGPAPRFKIADCVRARVGDNLHYGFVRSVMFTKGKFSGYRVLFAEGTWPDMRGIEELPFTPCDVFASPSGNLGAGRHSVNGQEG